MLVYSVSSSETPPITTAERVETRLLSQVIRYVLVRPHGLTDRFDLFCCEDGFGSSVCFGRKH